MQTPGRNAQLDCERGTGGGFHFDANTFVARVAGFGREDYGLVGQVQRSGSGIVEIYDQAIAVGGAGKGGNERDAARSAGQATMPVERAAVRFLAFHLDVIAPSRAITLLCAQQLIEDDVLQLFSKAGLSG